MSVVLTVTMPGGLSGVAADGLPFIPVVSAPVPPPEGTVPVTPVTPAPDTRAEPQPVMVYGPPVPPETTSAASTPLPMAVAALPTPLPAATPVPVPVPVATVPSPPPVAPTNPPAPSPAIIADAPASEPVAVGVPIRIRIGAAGIDANVEIVGLERDGSVGTPKNYDNTGWYEPGPRPGEPGNAVMLGHVDSAALKRGAVFWNLRVVHPGDDITVVSDDGVEHHFTVTGQQQYNAQNVPIAKIFGQADGVHLNLITCDATTPFNRRTGEYSGWLLVTADATP